MEKLFLIHQVIFLRQKMHNLGPWFVALLFNENDSLPTRNKGTKSKTVIVIHTYAYRSAAIKNALNPNDAWVTMQLVGPFSQHSHAQKFAILWERETRSNKGLKLQRGLDLISKYGYRYKVKMWSVDSDPTELVNKYLKKRKEPEISMRFPMSMQAIARLKMAKKIKLK